MSLQAEYETFAAAAGDFERLVAGLGSDSWDGPGLGEWNLRSLVGHTSRSLTTVTQYVDQPADREDIDSAEAYFSASAKAVRANPEAVTERGVQAGLALGSNPAEAVTLLVEKATSRLRGQTDVVLTTFAGGMWLSNYLPTRTFELAVHSLDIAAATGVPFRLDPTVALSAVALATRIAVLDGAADHLLLALTGRISLPEDFSVV